MKHLVKLKTPEYIIIGHLTEDITPEGMLPGGTALYSGLSAHALGFRVGILSSHQPGRAFPVPSDIQLLVKPSEVTTRFKNINSPDGRKQKIFQKALDLNAEDIPAAWLTAPIVHLGPVANEVNPEIIDLFPSSLICITPQGWLRGWNRDGSILFQPQIRLEKMLKKVQIASLSLEDVQYNEDIIERMADIIPVLAVTEAQKGARVYWNRDLRRFKAPHADEVDVTGAGDIFAAAFIFRYYHTRNPWEAARFANLVASTSVERKGLNSIPTSQEILKYTQEILDNR